MEVVLASPEITFRSVSTLSTRSNADVRSHGRNHLIGKYIHGSTRRYIKFQILYKVAIFFLPKCRNYYQNENL